MAIQHKQSNAWRIIRVWRHWQVQRFTTTENDKGWWNIGTPKDNIEDALSLMYTREPLKAA